MSGPYSRSDSTLVCKRPGTCACGAWAPQSLLTIWQSPEKFNFNGSIAKFGQTLRLLLSEHYSGHVFFPNRFAIRKMEITAIFNRTFVGIMMPFTVQPDGFAIRRSGARWSPSGSPYSDLNRIQPTRQSKIGYIMSHVKIFARFWCICTLATLGSYRTQRAANQDGIRDRDAITIGTHPANQFHWSYPAVYQNPNAPLFTSS